MNLPNRRRILQANAIYLLLASVNGILMDVAGIFFARGPESRIVAAAPHSGLGFLEAHGLACIFAIWLWRAEASSPWHLTAAAVHTLLGACNLIFWQIFVDANFLTGGYVFTTLHLLFALLQFAAAKFPEPRPSATITQGAYDEGHSDCSLAIDRMA